MFRDAFQTLCQWVAPHLPKHRSISVERKLLATLWFLANQEPYHSVAERFGMNRGTLHRIVKKVCEVLLSLRGDVIKWPQRGLEMKELSDQFETTAGFPGVVGVIDGTYIRIKGPVDETRASYKCKKGFPAMHLQVVCSKDLLFLDVETGNVGSVDDSEAFQNSALHALLESENDGLPAHLHLLGDSAYPLCAYLLVPFRANRYLSSVEVKFNKAHAATRSDVDRALGLLRGKFHRLKGLDMNNIHDVPELIVAACVLHNFIIRNDGVHSDDIDQPEQNETEDACDDSDNSGIEKRLDIAHVLS